MQSTHTNERKTMPRPYRVLDKVAGVRERERGGGAVGEIDNGGEVEIR